jgi:uncharacterized cofD-like protein
MYSKINVVCFGGGTGLPGLLSGLKHNPWLNITAVVNMFDTGGSSGELRDRFGILPPGDILKCLLALSKHESYAREILLRRIRSQEFPGHTGGNVLLLGLEKVFGDCSSAIDALGQLLSIRGRVVPVTLAQSTLCGRYKDGTVYRGETSVDIGVHEGRIVDELFLDPLVDASERALEAIEQADVFCIGPGSFYTSVLSNFLPRGIVSALQKAKGKLIYIANLLTEGRGMKGMQLEDIVAMVERQIDRSVDYVVANEHWPFAGEALFERYAMESKYPVISKSTSSDPRILSGDLWFDKEIARHDCALLAHFVSAVINRATEKIPSPQAASPSAL